MSRATATVVTSEYEGFSNTALESFVLGVPVITSFCCTDAHLLSEQGAALGFPVGDHAALRRQMLQTLSDADLCARLRENGRVEAERHSSARAVQAYETLVRDAVARAGELGRRGFRPHWDAARAERP
jgi:glycosyltransferase involved in cell wall biosynthesis